MCSRLYIFTYRINLSFFTGCYGFEVQWKDRKIQSTTSLSIPVAYGYVIPISCVDGSMKLYGPDNITCLDDNTFSGLDNVCC